MLGTLHRLSLALNHCICPLISGDTKSSGRGGRDASDNCRNKISVFDLEGRYVRCFGERGKGEGQFDSPCGICFTADCNLVVAEQDNRRVQIVREDGSFVRASGSAPAWGENGHFDDHDPIDVSVGPDGSIAVLHKGELTSRVQIFDGKGRFVRSIGEWSIESGGWEPGGLMDSTGVAHGTTGGEMIIVRDKGRQDVQAVGGKGGMLQIVGANGDSKVAWHSLKPELGFGQLAGVAVDANGADSCHS